MEDGGRFQWTLPGRIADSVIEKCHSDRTSDRGVLLASGTHGTSLSLATRPRARDSLPILPNNREEYGGREPDTEIHHDAYRDEDPRASRQTSGRQPLTKMSAITTQFMGCNIRDLQNIRRAVVANNYLQDTSGIIETASVSRSIAPNVTSDVEVGSAERAGVATYPLPSI